jgi:hypothetical protein
MAILYMPYLIKEEKPLRHLPTLLLKGGDAMAGFIILAHGRLFGDIEIHYEVS